MQLICVSFNKNNIYFIETYPSENAAVCQQ